MILGLGLNGLVAIGSARAATPTEPVFTAAFAPQQGQVAAIEQPLRDELCLNGLWKFQPVGVPKDFKPGLALTLPPPTAGGWDATPIRIPSPWNVNSFMREKDRYVGGDFLTFPSYPASWEDVRMGWLQRTLKVPAGWAGRRLILHFEAVAGDATVVVNGITVGGNRDIFMPFDVDATDALRPGQDNVLSVGVTKLSLLDQPGQFGRRNYQGGSFWGQHIVGIWQDVSLVALPAVHVSDVIVRPLVNQGQLVAEVTVRNTSAKAMVIDASGDIRPWRSLAGTEVIQAPDPVWTLDASVATVPAQPLELAPGQERTVKLTAAVGNRLKPWTPDSPRLYGLVLSLKSGKTELDRRYQRFGWREMGIVKDKLTLNGEPIQLKGDSWHFMGIPQMTRRYPWAWFRMLKDANANAVRFHAQPYPRFYLDMADEMGVMVLDETAIWASDGGPKMDSEAYWESTHDHIARLVRRDRNHPSVFGWSVCNEQLAVLRNVYRAPKELIERQLTEFTRWVDLVRSLDSTRPWISGDGEDDGDGRFPVLVGHYGDGGVMKRWSEKGLPWGIGEQSMAYYGTPKQVSKYNGARAFESQEGRMEGLAIECYDLIARNQRPLGASYCGVFNLAWYALQPLEIGLADTTRASTAADGVRFGAYVEGVFGVQPERLGPYCSTLNPGYDPRLPLYRPWPMFNAIQAANAPGGPKPCAWDKRPVPAPVLPPPTPHVSQVQFLAATASPVREFLEALGVPLAEITAPGPDACLVIDGVRPPAPETRERIDSLLAAGGTVVVWGVERKTLAELNRLLPQTLELTDREALSFLPRGNDPLVSGLDAANLYFTEVQKTPVMRNGLTGPLVAGGTPLIVAGETDWRRWNGCGEGTKTAALLRTEREAKAGGVSLVVVPSGKGRLVVSSFSPIPVSNEATAMTLRLFTNLGIIMGKPKSSVVGGAFNLQGKLSNTLLLGAFPSGSEPAAAVLANPRKGERSAQRTWQAVASRDDGVFNFKAIKPEGPRDNCAAWFSFWIFSPRRIDDLLVEPDVPKLDLLVGCDDGCEVYLGDRLLKADKGPHPMRQGQMAVEALPLQRGWNHILIKSTQTDGEWQLMAELRCSSPEFMSKLQTALENPDR
jgi:hypothetical protein